MDNSKKIECIKCGKMFEVKQKIIGIKSHWMCLCYRLTFIMFPICFFMGLFMIFYYINKGVPVPANNTLNIVFMITLLLFFVPFGIVFGPAIKRTDKKFDDIILRVENMIEKRRGSDNDKNIGG